MADPMQSLMRIIGTVLGGAADDGSEPVKIGGVNHTALPTYVDGNRVEAQYDSRGGLIVGIKDGGGTRIAGVVSQGDALSTGGQSVLLAEALQMAYNGATSDRIRTPNGVFHGLAAVAITAATPVAVWTPAAGKKFRMLLFSLTLSVAGSIIFKDAAAEAFRTPAGGASAILTNGPGFGNGLLSALANNVLNLDVSASGNVSGYILGTEE